jgi:hypothetical protein
LTLHEIAARSSRSSVTVLVNGGQIAYGGVAASLGGACRL